MRTGRHYHLDAFALLLLSACSARENLLLSLEGARQDVKTARALRAAEYAPDSLRLAEEALLSAEIEIRRREGRLNPLAGDDARAKLERALDAARIAAWAAEHNVAQAREEAQGLIWAASSQIENARQKTGRMKLPLPVHAQLRRAELAIRQANYLLERAEFHAASERAREADERAGGAHGESERLVARFRDGTTIETWTQWVDEAARASRSNGPPALVVNKSAHQAVLYVSGKPQRRFDVDLGYGSLHQKFSAGDGATPEGRYRVVRKKGRGQTIYYKALLLDYPNREDWRRFQDARSDGALEGKNHPGGLIEIHGDGGRQKDWTEGCVALKNSDIDYLFARLRVGSPVVIVGSCATSGGEVCP